MAITLQTVLPSKVLPRAPSPNSASPNPGVRSSITQFIPASPDASLDRDAFATSSAGPNALDAPSTPGGSQYAHTRSRGLSTSSNAQSVYSADSGTAGLKSPMSPIALGRKSMSAGAGSRRGIAHSIRVLGVDRDADAFDMAPLSSGQVDVSFEATLRAQPPSGKGKNRARDPLDDTEAQALFDVDLESGQPASNQSRATRLLQLGAQSMPWSKSRARTSTDATPPAVPSSLPRSLDIPREHGGLSDDEDKQEGGIEDEEGGDDDRQHLLYSGGEADRPGFFAPGDRSFGYHTLGAAHGGYDGRVGFEPLLWRERIWMITSACLVAVVVVVAILISIDVIDWPGDGIGNN